MVTVAKMREAWSWIVKTLRADHGSDSNHSSDSDHGGYSDSVSVCQQVVAFWTATVLVLMRGFLLGKSGSPQVHLFSGGNVQD